MSPILLLLLLSFINPSETAGNVRIVFSTSHRILLQFGFMNSSRQFNTTITPYSTRTAVIPLYNYTDMFDINVQLFSPFDKSELSPPIHRQFPLNKNTPSTDTIITPTVNLEVSIVYECPDKFYGEDCTIFCDPSIRYCDDYYFLPATIDENKTIDDIPSFCSTPNICHQNGVCVPNGNDGYCQCFSPYSGRFCEFQQSIDTFQLSDINRLLIIIIILIFILICFVYRYQYRNFPLRTDYPATFVDSYTKSDLIKPLVDDPPRYTTHPSKYLPPVPTIPLPQIPTCIV